MTIEPMKIDEERKILLPAVAVVLTLFALVYFAPKFFDTVLDRLENQREAEAAYYYKHYGDAIEKWESEKRNK